MRNGTTESDDVIGLEKYTGYEFQVLAFTSVGDGPKSNVRIKRTKEDGKKIKIAMSPPSYGDFFGSICQNDSVELRFSGEKPSYALSTSIEYFLAFPSLLECDELLLTK